MFLRYLTVVCLVATTIAAPEAPTLPLFIEGCPANPCPPQSECVDGVCLCISGTFLQNDQCVPAQVFPGKLHLRSTFQPGMEDRSSEIFRETAQSISDALFKALFGTQGYVRSDVVKLEPGSVIATVNSIYENTDITEEENQEQIQKEVDRVAYADELLDRAEFNITDLCEVEPFPCDVKTATCGCTNGTISCFCNDGYVSSPYSTKSCEACPSGYKAEDNECKECPFGYSGFNCNDVSKSTLLVVVAVSGVLGGVLLITILTLLIYCFGKGPSKNLNGRPDHTDSSVSSENRNKPTSFPDDDYAKELTEGVHTYVCIDEVQQING